MKAKRKTKLAPPIIITIALLTISILCGLFLIGLGIFETAEYKKTTENYESTTGYLLDYTLESPDSYDPIKKKHTSATYILIYNYPVNGVEYKVSTEYSTSIIPEIGSEREIFYDPSDPSKAVVGGISKHNFLFFMGGMFAGIPLIIILLVYLVLSDKIKKPTVNYVGLVFGLLFMAFGYGFMWLITGEISPKGIWEFYTSSFFFPLIIPPLLVVAGAFSCVKSIFFYNPEEK